jgi:hypothetical protein
LREVEEELFDDEEGESLSEIKSEIDSSGAVSPLLPLNDPPSSNESSETQTPMVTLNLILNFQGNSPKPPKPSSHRMINQPNPQKTFSPQLKSEAEKTREILMDRLETDLKDEDRLIRQLLEADNQKPKRLHTSTPLLSAEELMEGYVPPTLQPSLKPKLKVKSKKEKTISQSISVSQSWWSIDHRRIMVHRFLVCAAFELERTEREINEDETYYAMESSC